MKSFASALACGLFLPVAALTAQPAFQFDPKEVLLDEAVRIRVTGLAPNSKCIVRSQATFGGKSWQAQATFQADGQGIVDISRQAPSAGTYSGVDPMGLFWSMELQKDPPPSAPPHKIADPRMTHFEVECDNAVTAKAELKRWLLRPGVRVTDVKENGMVGRLFEPEGKERRPGLLVLSGSDGGISEAEAALLASHGYVTFALAYFRADGLPSQLVKIPLEYLKGGIDWLTTRESVDRNRLGVVGGSKGGELALLLASRFPELKAIVARAPSHVVWFGIGGSYRESSWTFEGKPLPCVMPNALNFPRVMSKSPIRLVDLYGPALDDRDSVAKARIPVEQIKGAVLLISGADDAMWPSTLMADQVVASLTAAKHKWPFEHLKYAGAGHGIPSSYVPTRLTIEAGGMAMGGSPEANARAQADSRPRVLRFLKEALNGR